MHNFLYLIYFEASIVPEMDLFACLPFFPVFQEILLRFLYSNLVVTDVSHEMNTLKILEKHLMKIISFHRNIRELLFLESSLNSDSAQDLNSYSKGWENKQTTPFLKH